MTNTRAKQVVEIVILLLLVSIVLVVATIVTVVSQLGDAYGHYQYSQAFRQHEVSLASPPPVTLGEDAESRDSG